MAGRFASSLAAKKRFEEEARQELKAEAEAELAEAQKLAAAAAGAEGGAAGEADAGGGGEAEEFEEHVNEGSGATYYFITSGARKGQSVWERPATRKLRGLMKSGMLKGAAAAGDAQQPQPQQQEEDGGGFEEHVDQTTGVTYYYNTQTGESVWEKPAAMKLRGLMKSGMLKG